MPLRLLDLRSRGRRRGGVRQLARPNLVTPDPPPAPADPAGGTWAGAWSDTWSIPTP